MGLNEKRGAFIVLEGTECSGKSTQARRLANSIEPSVLTVEPTRGLVGRLIRHVLANKDPEVADFSAWTLARLFAADRGHHVQHVFPNKSIAQICAEQGTVICDRYLMSSLAYQSVPQGVVGPSFADVWHLNRLFPTPDLTLFIDIPADLAFQRL